MAKNNHPKINGYAVSDKKAPAPMRKAYKSWADQRQRCSNPKDKRYKWWGGKGIKVEYNAYEFVKWYLGQWDKYGPFDRPNCSRIDHNKNYTLDNIMLGECSQNSKERMERVGPPTKGLQINAVELKTGKIYRFRSAYQAGEQTKVAKSNILEMINKVPTHITCGWFFFKGDA